MELSSGCNRNFVDSLKCMKQLDLSRFLENVAEVPRLLRRFMVKELETTWCDGRGTRKSVPASGTRVTTVNAVD